MRALSKSSRLSGASLPEVVAAYEAEVERLAADPEVPLSRGLRVKAGPFLSALVLAFLSLPEARRKAMAKHGVKLLDRKAGYSGRPGRRPGV
jgi:hypothetical protein